MSNNPSINKRIQDLVSEYRKENPNHHFMIVAIETLREQDIPEQIKNALESNALSDLPSTMTVVGSAGYYQSLGLAHTLIRRLNEYIDERHESIEDVRKRLNSFGGENPLDVLKRKTAEVFSGNSEEMIEKFRNGDSETPKEIREAMIEFMEKVNSIVHDERISKNEKAQLLDEARQELVRKCKELGYDIELQMGSASFMKNNEDDDDNDNNTEETQDFNITKL